MFNLQVMGSVEVFNMLLFLLSTLISLANGSIYCHMERTTAGSLDCFKLDGNTALRTPADFGELQGEKWDAVERISLKNTRTNVILAAAFKSAVNLRHLDLSENHFLIGPEVFAGLVNLRTLNVSMNMRANTENAIKSGSFDALKGLRQLDITNNLLRIDSVDTLSLNKLTSLRILDISLNLEIELTALGLGPSLKTLISSDTIINLEESSLAKATGLTRLTLTKAKLTDLPTGVFDACTNLRTLDLSTNSIKILPANVFSKLTQLRVLTLSNNELTALSDRSFINNKQLFSLDVSGNVLTAVSPQSFSSIQNLLILDLSKNRLARLPAKIFDGMLQLRDLQMNHNLLVSLPSMVFAKNVNLNSLSMNHNQIRSLPADTFLNNKALRQIFLKANRLDQFSFDLVKDLEELLVLDLWGNKLKDIPYELLNLAKLSVLNLACNNLVSLPNSFFRVGDNMLFKNVTLRGNPWRCGCLRQGLEEARANQVDYEYATFVDGETPSCMIGPQASIQVCPTGPATTQEIVRWQAVLDKHPRICQD